MHPRLLPKHRSRPGFTLIELLVVLAIIAILMALLMPWIAKARESARRQEAATIAKNVVVALNHYRGDYGTYPNLGPSAGAGQSFVLVGDPAFGSSQNNGALMDVLRAIPNGPNANHALNTRQVKYFQGKKAVGGQTPRDGFADGSEFPREAQGRLYDPWGTEYLILFETDGDETLDLGSLYPDLAGSIDAIKSPVAVICVGPDAKLGGKGYEGRFRKPNSTEAPDDIASWQ